MDKVIKSIYDKMIAMNDADEIAETFLEMDYSSEWDADTFLIEFEKALEGELEVRGY